MAAGRCRDPDTPVAMELRQFRRYLEEVRGLAATTRDYRVAHVREFLTRCFGDGAVDLRDLAPEHIEAFVMGFVGR